MLCEHSHGLELSGRCLLEGPLELKKILSFITCQERMLVSMKLLLCMLTIVHFNEDFHINEKLWQKQAEELLDASEEVISLFNF